MAECSTQDVLCECGGGDVFPFGFGIQYEASFNDSR